MAIGKEPTNSTSTEDNTYDSNKSNNCHNCSKSSNHDLENGQNFDKNPFDYGDGPQSHPKRRSRIKSFSKQSKAHRSLSSATATSLALIRQNPGCTLANIYILRILFWDILVSGGDVVTDFLRVSKILNKRQ